MSNPDHTPPLSSTKLPCAPRARFTGPQSFSAPLRAKYLALRAKYPDAYMVIGTGWCGPGHEDIAREMQTLGAENDAEWRAAEERHKKEQASKEMRRGKR